MIPPHGNELVDRVLGPGRSDAFRSQFDDGPTITLDQDLLIDVENIARGVYSPLRGFLTQNDFLKVINDLTLENGVPWPLPIVLDVGTDVANTIGPGRRLGLRRPDGEPLGIIDVKDVYRYSTEDTSRALFNTTDVEHPGVKMIQEKDPFLVGGSIQVFEDALARNDGYYLTPKESRVLFKHRDWDSVVGFQTRNVPHRAHEYLQKSALEHVDGLFLQPKIGDKKPGDYTNDAILRGYETLIDHYYPEEYVALSMFKSRMWYAGPREAIFDSIVRKNHGCTHFIIGRDHAGVGDYYDDFEAQSLFEELGGIGIQPFFYNYAFYCTICDGIVSEKICPHDDESRVEPSGTKLRKLLMDDERPPSELMRPEVAERVLTLDNIFTEE